MEDQTKQKSNLRPTTTHRLQGRPDGQDEEHQGEAEPPLGHHLDPPLHLPREASPPQLPTGRPRPLCPPPRRPPAAAHPPAFWAEDPSVSYWGPGGRLVDVDEGVRGDRGVDGGGDGHRRKGDPGRMVGAGTSPLLV